MADLPDLTQKQREVLALVADNRTSKEIAVLLGISESAVNQRIEIVRARLGGLPRGQLARLYRQKYAPELAENGDSEGTWQKIQLPENGLIGHDSRAESIPFPASDGSHRVSVPEGDGSQLSAYFYEGEQDWLGRETPAVALARGAAILAIIMTGMALAAAITQWLSANLIVS